MPNFIDLTGKKFGYLTVLNRDLKDPNKWVCKCDHNGIGEPTIILVTGNNLRTGATKSCGCYKKTITAQNNIINKTIHGGRHTKLYSRWIDIRHRHKDQNIIVCEQWNSINGGFEAFREWSYDNGYDENKELQLHRINRDLGFSPDNCEWVKKGTVSSIKHNNRLILYNGRKYTVAEFAKLHNMNSDTVLHRLNKDWSIDDIINRRPEDEKKIKYLTYNNNTTSLSGWGSITGMGANVIYKRLSKGWSAEKTLSTPPKNGFINAIYFEDPNTGKPIPQDQAKEEDFIN